MRTDKHLADELRRFAYKVPVEIYFGKVRCAHHIERAVNGTRSFERQGLSLHFRDDFFRRHGGFMVLLLALNFIYSTAQSARPRADAFLLVVHPNLSLGIHFQGDFRKIGRQVWRNRNRLVIGNRDGFTIFVIQLLNDTDTVFPALEGLALERHLSCQGVVDVNAGIVQHFVAFYFNPAEIGRQVDNLLVHVVGVIHHDGAGIGVVVFQTHLIIVLAKRHILH